MTVLKTKHNKVDLNGDVATGRSAIVGHFGMLGCDSGFVIQTRESVSNQCRKILAIYYNRKLVV